MNVDELYEYMRVEIKQFQGNYNSNEYSQRCKTLLKASFELEEYPAYYSLESDWQLIESENPLFKEERSLNRTKSPLSYFIYHMDSGFYPPPEVLLALLACFQTYFDAEGDVSLDEAFFGRIHKKKSSQAFLDSVESKYFVFHKMYVQADRFFHSSLKGKPLVDKAIDFLDDPLNTKGKPDPESFLRGYRRWLQNLRDSQ